MTTIFSKINDITGYLGLESRFGRMLLLSILFHTAAFTPFLITGSGSPGGPTVTFIDLEMSMDASPGSPSAVSEKRDEGVENPEESTLQNAPPAPSELDRLTDNNRRSVADAAGEASAADAASIGLGITNGYFASIGDGESLREDIREYYLDMLKRINEKWWLYGDNRLTPHRRAVFSLVIARDGAIVGKMLVESSGNPVFDRAMLRTLEASSPLPPLPESYRGDLFHAPLRFNAPLNLLRSLG